MRTSNAGNCAGQKFYFQIKRSLSWRRRRFPGSMDNAPLCLLLTAGSIIDLEIKFIVNTLMEIMQVYFLTPDSMSKLRMYKLFMFDKCIFS